VAAFPGGGAAAGWLGSEVRGTERVGRFDDESRGYTRVAPASRAEPWDCDDLAGVHEIAPEHVAEAVQSQALDRTGERG